MAFLRVSLRALITPAFVVTIVANVFGQNIEWKARVDFTGGADSARAVVSVDQITVVAGTASVAAGGLDLGVRAYDKRTGALLWIDQTPAFSGLATNVFLATAGNAVYFAGYKPGATPSTTDIFVRAYELTTGRVLWDNIFDKGRDDLPQGLDANLYAVVVAGYGGNTGGSSLDYLVRAYDPLTGAILWEDRVDKTGTDDYAWAVALDGNQVFVAGTTTVGVRNDLFLRAYDARSGKLKWESRRTGTFPVQLATASGRLFVAGYSGSNAFLAAVNSKTGSLLWQDTSAQGMFLDVTVKSNYVIAAGGNDKRGILVRLYNQTGGLIWQDQSSPQPGFAEFISAVTATDTAIYVAGLSGKDLEDSEFLVRGYNLTFGFLNFDERTQRAPSSHAADIAVAGNFLTVVGSASRDTSPANTDWVIRTYRIAQPVRSTPFSKLSLDRN